MTNRTVLDKTEAKLGLPGLSDALADLPTSEPVPCSMMAGVFAMIGLRP